MKKILFLILFTLPTIAFAQLGVAYHQSALSFVGVHYEINDRIRPELRLGTDSYLDDINIEIIATYDFLDKEEYELYAGLGIMTNAGTTNLAIPIGLNLYPFANKKFGFQMEITPLIGESDIFRGSLGIRYRFNE